MLLKHVAIMHIRQRQRHALVLAVISNIIFIGAEKRKELQFIEDEVPVLNTIRVNVVM
jgi:hypothetical protein